jgi:hypothetical protein
MKMADILRNLADKLEKIENGSAAGDNMGKEADDYQHDVAGGAEEAGAGDVEVGVMVPPLQQKLEILKKSAGMDSELDNSDELDAIKKLTGIQAVVQHVASEDNDITG